MEGLFPAWTCLIGGAIGAFFGSFLNVVIYRLPRGLSIAEPKNSFCPICKHRLTAPDLVPLLSWAFLQGKCRHCKAPVPFRYFFVEVLAFALWAGLWYRYLAAGEDVATFLAYAAAGSALIAVIFIDWELYIIPDQLNAFLWLVGILFNVWLFVDGRPEAWTWGIPSALAGWITGVAVIWGIALFGRVVFRKDAMGHGDIKMARGIGAIVFPSAAMISFGAAVALGSVLGVLQLVIRGKEPVTGGVPADMLRQGREPERVESEVSEGADAAKTSESPQTLDDDWEPEPIPTLLKSGLGYLLCIDIAGLFAPKLYERWFGEPQFVPLEEDEAFEVERTMIPFGPYLALGAIAVLLFRRELFGLVDAYMEWINPPLGQPEL